MLTSTKQKNSLSDLPTTPTSPTFQPTSPQVEQPAIVNVQRMSFKDRQKYFEQEIQQQNQVGVFLLFSFLIKKTFCAPTLHCYFLFQYVYFQNLTDLLYFL